MHRIPQPPINPAVRAIERHDFWPGFIVTVAGAAIAFCGVRHLTGIGTVDGDNAREIQLMKAFSSGGVQYASQLPPPPPPRLDTAVNPEQALAQWAKDQANRQPPSWKIRVDLGAKAACPT